MAIGAPLVSVLIPAYNRAALLPRAIGGVLRQTLQDFEVVVVDDGSEDETAAVVDSYTDPRVRLVRLPVKGGVARARNAGVSAARSALVAFLDSDDEWRPEKLERQVARLKGRGGGVVYCRYSRHVPAAVRLAPGPAVARGDVFRALLRGWDPLPSCVLMRRVALAGVGPFDESLPAFADYEMWLRLAEHGADFVAVDEALVVKHEESSGRISSDPDLLLRGFQGLDRKWAARIREQAGDREYRRWRARLLASIAYVEVQRSMTSGHRAAAWKHCLQMLPLLPWSARYPVFGIGMALLGLRGYRALARLKAGVAGSRSRDRGR